MLSLLVFVSNMTLITIYELDDFKQIAIQDLTFKRDRFELWVAAWCSFRLLQVWEVWHHQEALGLQGVNWEHKQLHKAGHQQKVTEQQVFWLVPMANISYRKRCLAVAEAWGLEGRGSPGGWLGEFPAKKLKLQAPGTWKSIVSNRHSLSSMELSVSLLCHLLSDWLDANV